jgi:hypothetical protein
MENCALAILTLPGQDPPSCSVERLDRAKRRLRLPLRHKGAGLSSVAERHAIAYFSSVVSCAAVDDELAWNIDGLQRFASDTHARVLARLGPANELTTNVEDIICRSDPIAMLNTGYFAEMFTEAAPKLSASLAHAVQAVAAQSLQDDLQARADGSFCTESDLTAACSHGDLQLVLTAKLSDKYNRLEPQDFVAWMRVFLQLPPLQRLMNAQPTVGFDYDIERCMGDHATGNDALLDLHGGHDNSNCAPTSQGKHAGHNMYKWTLHRFARRVPGVEVKVEPKTHEILLNQFSEERCRTLFPKLPSRARSRAIKLLVDELDRVKAMPTSEARTAAFRKVVQEMDELNEKNQHEQKQAVRLDLYLRSGEDELLVDTTCTHPMTKTNRPNETKRTWERLLSGVKSVRELPAAAIETARAKKYQTYNPLLYVIKKQVLDGRRQKEPFFTPAVLTTAGERGPGNTVIQEWLAMRYKASLEATETAMGPRPDGYQVSGMVGKFRAEFRMALRMVAIRRLGRMQRAAGLPPDCTRKAADLLQGWEGQQEGPS